MSAGQTMGAQANEIKHTNALRDLYQQQGANILKGDQNALGALAGLDPGAAMDIQVQQQNMSVQQEKLGLLRAEGERAAQRLQMEMSATQLEQEQANLKRGLAAAMTAQTPEEWDAIASQYGAGDLVGQYGNRDAVIAFYSGLDSTLDRMKGDDQPTSVQEFEYAQQNGYEGTYNDFLNQKGKSGATNISTTVNTGDQPDARPMADKPPKGYQRRWDPERQSWVDEPIPGGEIDREQQAESEKQERAAQSGAENEAQRSGVVQEQVKAIRSSLENGGWFDLPEVGIVGSRLASGRVNQEAVDVKNRLDTLQGMVAFDRLTKLKQASASGASGLGQVTEREIALLAAQLGTLDNSSSRESILQTLKTIEDVFGKLSPEAEAYLIGATDKEPWGAQQPAQPSTGFQFQNDEQKRVFEKYSRP